MEQWIQEPNAQDCRPCALALTSTWYEEELEEQGRKDLAEALNQLRTGPDAEPVRVAKELGLIKEKVVDPLRARLRDFDCAAQTEVR